VAEANPAFDAIYPADRRFAPDVLIEAGQARYAECLRGEREAAERGLQQSPYNRDAWWTWRMPTRHYATRRTCFLSPNGWPPSIR